MQGRLRHSAIHLPPYPYAWADEDSFYRSLFHELGHWTQDKVKRQQTIVAMENDLPDPSERDQVAAMFGAGLVGPRALEELVAELSAVLVARALHAGEMVERNAVYIASWLSHMKRAGYDASAQERIFSVASDLAYESAAYLLRPLNLQPQET